MKNLKQLVRNVVDPNRDLGHVDRDHVGKKRGPTLGENPTLSTEQSSIEKTEESTLHYRQTTLSTNISKAQDSQEHAKPIDTDTAVASAAAWEEVGEQGKREENKSGGGELCKECI